MSSLCCLFALTQANVTLSVHCSFFYILNKFDIFRILCSKKANGSKTCVKCVRPDVGLSLLLPV